MVELLPWTGTTIALDSVSYCYVPFYLQLIPLSSRRPRPRSPLPSQSSHPASPKPKPIIAPSHAWGTPPTWESPVSIPESQASAQGLPPTWDFPISVPASLNPRSPSLAVSLPSPTACSSHPVASSWIPKIFPPRFH